MADEEKKFWPKLFFIIAICGAVGGAAPSLIELAGMARANDMPSGSWYIAMGIFAFLGAFVACVYKERKFHKAFFLGIGAPALIVAGGNAVDNKISLNIIPSMFPSAYASEYLLPSSQLSKKNFCRPFKGQGRYVFVPKNTTVFGGNTVEGKAELIIRSPTGYKHAPLVDLENVKIKPSEDIGFGEFKAAKIPLDTKSVSLNGVLVGFDKDVPKEAWKVQTGDVSIPKEGDLFILLLSKEQTFWSGFLKAMGLKRLAKDQIEYSATLEQIEEKSFECRQEELQK